MVGFVSSLQVYTGEELITEAENRYSAVGLVKRAFLEEKWHSAGPGAPLE